MRKFIKGNLFVILIATLLSACTSQSSDSIDFIPCKADKDENWGMIGPDGKMLFSDEFESQPSMVVNGVFTVREHNGISVYTASEKPAVLGDLENLKDAGIMSEGLIPVSRKGQRITYYDKAGKEAFVLEPVKGTEITMVQSRFTDSRAIVNFEDGTEGVIDTKGKVIVGPGKYSSISVYNEGIAIAIQKPKNDTVKEKDVFFLNPDGKEVTKLKGYEPRGYFYQGYAAAKKDDKWGLINQKGEFTKLPAKVKGVFSWNKKYVIFNDSDGKVGVVNLEGEIVVRAKYDEMFPLADDKFIAKTDNDKWFIVNDKGEREAEIKDADNTVFPIMEYAKQIGFKTDFEIISKDGDDYFLLKSNGEPVTKDTYFNLGLDLPSWVSTDYFNVAGAAKKLVENVTAKGFENVNLGTPLYKYFTGSPSNHTYTDHYYFNDLEGGYQYTISGYAYTNKYIATSSPVYTTQYYYGYAFRTFDHYSYSWNHEALCDRITLSLTTPKQGYFTILKDAVVKELTAKGYAKTSTNEAAISVLKNGSTYAVVLPKGSSSSDVELDLFTAAYWERRSADVISRARNLFASIKSKQGKFDDRDADDDVDEYDTLAVEEVEAYEDTYAVVDTVVEVY